MNFCVYAPALPCSLRIRFLAEYANIRKKYCSLKNELGSRGSWLLYELVSVSYTLVVDPEPDPYVFGPPRSGSFHLFDFLSTKADVNVPSKSN
jgi:hypothetical protein